MPRNAAAALKGAEEWNELPSAEEIERRRRLLAEIRALRSHPVTKEEKEFWREFDEEVRGPQPPLDAPVTSEEMEKRRRIAARIKADLAKTATEEDEKEWQEFLDLGKERLTFR
jgi:hypothetical protein